MPRPVKATLRGSTYHGEASDIHALILAGFMMPNFDEVIEDQKGLYESFKKFSSEQKALLENPDASSEELAESMAHTWSERIIIRIGADLELRALFAQLIKEIFPSIPDNIVKPQRKSDKKSLNYEDCSVSLDTTEVLELITPVVATLNTDEALLDARPTPVVSPITIPAETVTHTIQSEVAPTDDRIAELEAQIKALKTKNTGRTDKKVVEL
jgi:hypothetical protein